MWEDFSKTVGFWADMDNPYVTYDDNFIESEWWALKEIWNKTFIQRIQNRSLLPTLRYPVIFSGGCAGL